MKNKEKNTKPTLGQAIQIANVRDDEALRVLTCVRAEICPECGAKLLVKSIRKGMFRPSGYVQYCSNDLMHYCKPVKKVKK